MTEPSLGLDPATNIRTALAMADGGVAMKRESLRRSHPDATEAELSEMIHEWLAERLQAGRGAGAGVPGSWPRKRR